ncbi:hypothetical protein ANANG_G00272960 [Anguilla anguilla]|uniref:Protein FAM117B n=1 Tax=Anguilla anguilla TaxID=7936 RepID=A0A9D3LLF0_ANGAN|nr:hypothetical protein ANANG_G00272960 [Anguilla anguilla]
MKATVPFQLKLQSQPPLQTRSPHGTSSGGNSPTRSSSSNNSSSSKGSASGCEATGTRTSTSSSRSPTRAVSASASAVISPLAPSSVSPPFSASHASPAAAVGTQTGSASSPSSGGNPAVTTHVSASGTSGATGRPPQPPPQAPSQQQLTVSASHGNIHNSGNSNVITSLSAPPFSVSARSPCSSPTQPLLWLSDCSLVATSLQTPHFSASPSSSSSSSSSSSGGNRERPQPPPQRSSPEHGRQSPERRSPSSPIFREKLRPAPAIAPSGSSSCASSTSCSSGSGVHHSPSLDTLTGPYLSGHWPRDGCHAQCAPCMRDKATQTPSAWADECSEKRRSSHKRSASWGSTDQLKEIAKLRQQLQRSKHSSRHHRDKERKSPFNGNHAAVSQSQAPIPKSVLIPIPISKPVSRFQEQPGGPEPGDRAHHRPRAGRARAAAGESPPNGRAPDPRGQPPPPGRGALSIAARLRPQRCGETGTARTQTLR